MTLTPRNIALLLCFCAFLVPVSAAGNSVNYGFMLVPLFVVLATGRCENPGPLFNAMMIYYVLIFVVAATYQYEFYSDAGRRIISFVLFMSMFSFAFVKVTDDMVQAFKAAVVIVGVGYAIGTTALFFIKGGSSLGFEAKDIVGTQRFGFIYLLGLWVAYLSPGGGVLWRLARPVVCTVLLIGLALTFSRSSILALGASGGLFMARAFLAWLRRPNLRAVPRVLLAIIGIAGAIALLGATVPIVFDFFDQRLLTFLANSDAVDSNVVDPETSEGTRVFIWTSILDYLARNPVTGAGYLGVWSLHLFDTGMSGSAHSQYADVLFRSGFVGFGLFLLLMALVGRELYRREQGLFWGFFGVMVYGFMHETFKESHGGFVLAFLVGMLAQRLRATAEKARHTVDPATLDDSRPNAVPAA